MDLLPFLIMSAASVGAITLLVWKLDRRSAARLADDEAVRARFAEDFPRETVRRIDRSTDSSAALIELARPEVFGLVVRLGRRFTTRCVHDEQLGAVGGRAGHLSLTLDDFTLPRVELELGAASDRWRERLQRRGSHA